MCPSEVRHSKASDLAEEELMSLHGVLLSRMKIVLIKRCRTGIEKSIAKGPPRLHVPDHKIALHEMIQQSIAYL
jgi:hypothetical protein